MKKILCAAMAALSCVTMFMFGGITAYAASDNSARGFDGDVTDCCVIDDKGLFDDQPELLDELNDMVRETAEELEMYIVIYLSDTAMNESSTRYFADTNYDNIIGPDTDGVFYYMDLSEQYSAYDYISTSGKAILVYDDHIDAMLSRIFSYLPASGEEIYAEDIYEGIGQICSVLEVYGEYEPGFFDYEYIEQTGKYVFVENDEIVVSTRKPPLIKLRAALIGVAGGIIIAVICYFVTKSNYKFKKSCNPNVYVAREQTEFTRRDDHFIRQYTTKTKIQSSSGGGGRSGGGGGGGSHGGGGGHR